MPEAPASTPLDNGTLDSASTAIAGLLSRKREEPKASETQPKPTPESERSTETATEETPAAETTEETTEEVPADETQETDEAPVIEPRKFKVKVAGQEQEVTEDELLKGYSRTADYTRKTQELATERQRFEQEEKARVIAERQTYATYLGQIKAALEAQTPKEPDWESLRAQVTPEVFAAEVLAWQTRSKNIEKVEAEQAKVRAQQEKDAKTGYERYLTDQETKLQEAIPEFKDSVKGAKLQTELQEFGRSLGFTDDDLRSVTDHRLVVALHKAMLFDRAQAKTPAVKQKIETALAASAPGQRQTAKPKNALAAAKSRLERTGSLDDGAAAIAALLGGAK